MPQQCAGGGPAPEWLTRALETRDGWVYERGEATGRETLEGALTDARLGATRKLVEAYFGARLRALYEAVRREVGREVVDRLTAESAGRIWGVRESALHCERDAVPRPGKDHPRSHSARPRGR
jgi:hypothetical protein